MNSLALFTIFSGLFLTVKAIIDVLNSLSKINSEPYLVYSSIVVWVIGLVYFVSGLIVLIL